MGIISEEIGRCETCIYAWTDECPRSKCFKNNYKYYVKEQEKERKFEIGKTYEHENGTKMTIIGRLKTHTWGECLIGEENTGELCPVGEEEENFIGWREIIEDGNDD